MVFSDFYILVILPIFPVSSIFLGETLQEFFFKGSLTWVFVEVKILFQRPHVEATLAFSFGNPKEIYQRIFVPEVN